MVAIREDVADGIAHNDFVSLVLRRLPSLDLRRRQPLTSLVVEDVVVVRHGGSQDRAGAQIRTKAKL